MTAAFLITLREGIEAALIVGILAAYLVKIDRRDALKRVWIGVAAAAGLSVTAGLAIAATIGRLPLAWQETLEGLAGLAAVGILTWMLFWMRRQGRAIKGHLESAAETALSAGSTVALVSLAFVAVVREGLETVLFLVAVFSSAGDTVPTLAGAVLGLVVAVGIGWAIFVGGVRVNLRTFFTATGAVLIFVAAGLVAFAVAAFGEAGLIANGGTTYDLGGILSESSPLGALLAGFFGYRSSPTPLELVAYVGYLIPILVLFLAGDRLRRLVPSPAA